MDITMIHSTKLENCSTLINEIEAANNGQEGFEEMTVAEFQRKITIELIKRGVTKF